MRHSVHNLLTTSVHNLMTLTVHEVLTLYTNYTHPQYQLRTNYADNQYQQPLFRTAPTQKHRCFPTDRNPLSNHCPRHKR